MPITKTALNSRPFALCSVISVTRPGAALGGQRIGIGRQRDLLQEARERGLLGARGVLARDADELLEVLDAARGLDRALGLERLDHARAGEQRLEQLADRRARRPGRAARP